MVLTYTNSLKPILLKFILCFLIVSVGSISFSYGQMDDIRFKHYTVEDGLSQNSVYAILQDHHGFMWFGTRTGGLNKFNGYSFFSYKRHANDSLSISSNEILALCEDKDGMIWVGTRNGGVNRYDETCDCFYNYLPNSNDSSTISSKTVSCIFEDAKANLWFGTNYGLCMYNRERDNFIWHADKQNFKNINIKSIIKAGDNLLWIGGIQGVFLYNTQSREILKHYVHDENNAQSIGETYIKTLTIDSNGKLWAGTHNNGLSRLDDLERGIFTHFRNDANNKSSLSSNIIRTLHLDKKGVLWVGTKLALEKVIPDQQAKNNPAFIHYTKDENNLHSINQNSVFSFYEADDDNIWVGNYIGGINQFYNGHKKFNHIKHNRYNSNSLSNNVVSSFVETEEGIWIGTEGGGLNLYTPETGKYKVYTMDANHPYGLKSNHIKALHLDVQGDLWVGTSNGLFLFDTRLERFINYLEGSSIYSITEGVTGEIWVGTNQNLFKVSKSNFNILEYNAEIEDLGISAKGINMVFKDSKERIWIGTKIGLYRYNRQKNSFDNFNYNKNDNTSLSHSHCTSINEDNEGNIWIGTLDGLNRFDEEKEHFVHFGEIAGLPDNVISNLLFDNSGYLWLTTNKGLSKLNISALLSDDQLSNSTTENIVRNYDKEDGLQAMEFRLNSSFKTRNGELFFGGANGFNSFYPDSVKDNPHLPKVAIIAFKLFNENVFPGAEDSPITEPICLTKKITLSHKQSVISFEFAALNYTSPSKNQYAYTLEGYDKGWNYIGTRREATYTSLPAGNYVFRVKASNNDGVWNNDGVYLELKITPPVWKRWWFRILSIGIVLSVIALYVSARLTKERKINRMLELKVLERTTEIREKNKLLSEKTNFLNESNSVLVERQKLIEKQTRELKAQRNKLAEANEVKNILFSVIAHDLKSPFNSIMGLSELLANDSEKYDQERKKSFANSIFKSSKIIVDLITSLLLWSRSQMGKISPSYKKCSVNELIKDNIKLADLQAKEKNIHIKNAFGSEEIIISLDSDLISTVVRNLLSNAIKFSFPGGVIVVSCLCEANVIIISVRDSGIGISEEVQETLFHRHTENVIHGTNNEKGTGLGLLICQDFIKLHGGRIWVNSEPGKGSEFSFSLPIK